MFEENESTKIEKIACRLVLDYLHANNKDKAYCAVLSKDTRSVEENNAYRDIFGNAEECPGILPVGSSNTLSNIVKDYLAIQAIFKEFINDIPVDNQMRSELDTADSSKRKLQFILKVFKANITNIDVAKSMGVPDYNTNLLQVDEQLSETNESSSELNESDSFEASVPFQQPNLTPPIPSVHNRTSINHSRSSRGSSNSNRRTNSNASLGLSFLNSQRSTISNQGNNSNPTNRNATFVQQPEPFLDQVQPDATLVDDEDGDSVNLDMLSIEINPQERELLERGRCRY